MANGPSFRNAEAGQQIRRTDNMIWMRILVLALHNDLSLDMIRNCLITCRPEGEHKDLSVLVRNYQFF
jgi:hypothetical protein